MYFCINTRIFGDESDIRAWLENQDQRKSNSLHSRGNIAALIKRFSGISG
jgi:hypothetical protein